MQRRGLLLTELALLGEIVARRDPGLTQTVDLMGDGPFASDERARLRRVIVDELCELPADAGRRALELEDLLRRLNDA